MTRTKKILTDPEFWICIIAILALIGFLPGCQEKESDHWMEYGKLLRQQDSIINSLRKTVLLDSLEIQQMSEPIHDTVDVCNPEVKSIPDGYEQDRKAAQKVYDQYDAMNMRRICGCPKAGDSPEKMEELENKWKSFKSVQHDQKILDKEVEQYKKEICK